MKRKIVLLLCLAGMLCFTFQACEDEDNTAQIGVCLKQNTNDWRKALKLQAEASLNKYGLRYRIYQTEDDAKQNDTLLTLIDKGCEVLIIVPGESDIESGVAEATKAGIPIVFVESAVGDNYETLITIDNETIGKSAAGFFNNLTGLNKIALFTVKQDETSSSGRIAGIKSELNDELKDKIIEISLDTYTSANGTSAANSILTNEDYQDIDAIYAQDDEIALGVLEALEADENGRIKAVVGCGGASAFFKKIKESETINLATTLYSPAQFMEKSVEVANNLLMGVSPDSKAIELPSTLIDKSNVDDYNNYQY